MSARSLSTGAIPAIRGRVQAGAPLAPFTWFRVGGPAEWLARPADADDLEPLGEGAAHGTPTRPVRFALTTVEAIRSVPCRCDPCSGPRRPPF